MEHNELIRFMQQTSEGLEKMTRRQRWEFRRDMKDYCRLLSARGK